jgi:ABC-type multidrug transport system fused ATPase/permease subunit
MRADKILVLDKGRIIQHGTHRELMAQDGIYRQIYHLQASVEQDMTPVNGREKVGIGE